jgi:hypothetical protein
MLYNFGTPKCALRPETLVLHLVTCRRLAKCSETLPNIILGPMEKNGCFTTSVPRNSAFRPETQVLHLLRAEGYEILSNSPKHHFGSNGEEWML